MTIILNHNRKDTLERSVIHLWCEISQFYKHIIFAPRFSCGSKICKLFGPYDSSYLVHNQPMGTNGKRNQRRSDFVQCTVDINSGDSYSTHCILVASSTGICWMSQFVF